MTREQAIAWVQSKLGQALDFDGQYGAQSRVPIKLLGFFTCSYRVFLELIPTKMNSFVVHLNPGLPFITRFIPDNTINTSCIVIPNSAIPDVGRVFYHSKVAETIIKGVAIDMVDTQPLRATHKPSMKLGNLTPRLCIESLLKVNERVTLHRRSPLTAKFRNKIVSSFIKNDLVSSSLSGANKLVHNISLSLVPQKVKELV